MLGGERNVAVQGGRGTFSLVVGGVRADDLGRYTCQATNQAGSRQVTVEILLEGVNLRHYVSYLGFRGFNEGSVKLTASVFSLRFSWFCLFVFFIF